MRRIFTVLAIISMIAVTAGPAAAHTTVLDGPDPAMWLSDPGGVDGDSGVEQGDPVIGASGSASVDHNKATIRVRAAGLEAWHTYTMWVVYFNDSTLCVDGCNGPDLAAAGGGVIYGTGRIAWRNGKATFRATLAEGAGAESVGDTPPPPFAFAPYAPGPNNEFHVVIRSHGPIIRGQLWEQLTTYGGGCETNVGPAPEQMGDFPVPSAQGECGDVQLYVFS
jgi:hypothetical protein